MVKAGGTGTQGLYLTLAKALACQRLGLSPKSSGCALPAPHHLGRKEECLQGLRVSQRALLVSFPGKKGLEKKKIQLGLVGSLRVRYARNLSHVEDSVTKNLPHPWARKMLDLMSFILAG